MRIHEFQAKHLLARYGLIAPEGSVAITAREAGEIAQRLGGPVVVKAQIHAGGRARAGGIQRVENSAAAEVAAGELLGKQLVTAQTGAAGQIVRRVLVERALPVRRELHLALLVDSTSGEVMLIGSERGGADIEEQAARGEVRIRELRLGTGNEARAQEVGDFVATLGLEGALHKQGCALVDGLRRAFVELDASLIEINPLAITEDGRLAALDAKMTLDDNALFRHPELAALRDEDDTSAAELQAQRHQLNYVQLDGDIGMVANGAGLGLATLDMVVAAKGRPANFMDIRTTAKSLDIAHGFGLLLDNPKTRAILINVHGGGMQACDTIAEGLGIALRRTGRSLPLVVRLAGNNADFGRSRLRNFGCAVIDCPDMWTAATKAVALAQKGA
ncbi:MULTISPECIES: ADP-forming succinate--CoA ligase subunit beta [unclassified Bosea (in: a-proteobacteria)]|uniref:ADP-forming succinate--CoA ligase subunit beta n=1 Tax=unclassified Bosea (in: a-proteobacteria) TaxID=2653178 RepID=UPI000F751E6B|nr:MULTISPECIES: ADP-forming succinate--CoA ligase subunit beta [unclassified Bosea (in: a-proteobacteria)]AZO78279.1 succinate--CoA ligase subunit beta [Bosea sp. Tri-49]RXT20234.1 succinate--CoA ligase subunit beta [Bosea sp. Tri-39]RXT37106.1 succinate--CoA ligase subunit beta [Bosea sp. Tri-54]